jgi:thiol-disulfide isomerase/thioredoxin
MFRIHGSVTNRVIAIAVLALVFGVPRAGAIGTGPEPAGSKVRLAPNFRITTLDGSTLTREGLSGKVVLIDFWATWCEPCVRALPRIREIAGKFEGQPFIVIGINLDSNDKKLRQFIANNEVNWPQYREGWFHGPMKKLFAVHRIPATFTIDADGVLEDQHVGDADIEGKLKKLIARAVEMGKRAPEPVVADKSPSGAQ